jgi:ABC-type multidrug transport system fused ATPase/permease subunit
MAEMVKSTSLRASLLSSRSIKQCSFLEHLEETTSSRDQSSISGNRGKRASYSMLISGFQPHSPSVNVKFGESLEDSALVPFDAPTAQATPKEGGHHTDTFVSPSRVGFVQWINAMQLGQNAFLIPLTYVFYQLGLTYYWQVAFWWCQLFFGFSGVMFQATLGCVLVVMALSRFSNDFLVYKSTINGAQRMRKNFCECVLNAPMTFFMTENIGPLVDVFSGDLSTVSEVLIDSCHCAIIYTLIVLGSMAIAMYYYPYLSAVSVFVLAACVWLQVVYRGRLKQVSLDFQKANNEVFHSVSDLIEGVKILRTANGTRWALDLLSEVFHAARIAVVASEKCTIWLNSRSCILGLCVSWSLTLVAYYFISDPASRRVVINGSSLYIVFLQWAMKTVGLGIYSMGSVERIHSYLQCIPHERRDGQPLDTKWPKEGDIELKNLCLTYGPNLPPALDDVSFKLAPASKVGVIGRTGSGKSSLLVALFRLIQPSSGDMVVGGCSITNVRLDSLRQQMSVIPQVRARFRCQMHQPQKWPHSISSGTCYVLRHPSAEC